MAKDTTNRGAQAAAPPARDRFDADLETLRAAKQIMEDWGYGTHDIETLIDVIEDGLPEYRKAAAAGFADDAVFDPEEIGPCYFVAAGSELYRLKARTERAAIREARAGKWCPEWPPEHQTVDVVDAEYETVAARIAVEPDTPSRPEYWSDADGSHWCDQCIEKVPFGVIGRERKAPGPDENWSCQRCGEPLVQGS